MLLRLWWKDARQFWPIWAFLILAATGVQGLLLHYDDPEARRGLLAVYALCWTGLYAFAVGAAAFAGERETGTLRFLDILPASRRVVWAGKVSFAFVTTMALAVVLLAIAALGSDHWGMDWPYRLSWNELPMLGLLPVALVAGLLCSSIMNNALLAALAAMGLATLSWVVLLSRLDRFYGFGWEQTREHLAWLIGGMVTALIASHVAFTWPRPTRRLRFPIRFQSPIVVTPSDPARDGREPSRAGSGVAEAAVVPVPIPYVASTVSARPWSADRPRPRSRFTEFRYLAWQAIREGFRIWCYLLALGMIVPGGVLLLGGGNVDPTPFVIWNWLIALMAGVSVFGLENQRRTYRFLVHHGARPGTVWLAKLAVWCFGLAMIWVPLACLAVLSGPLDTRRFSGADMGWVVLTLPLVFAVGQLCGMAIPRGITAGVIAIVVTIALGAAQAALVMGLMMPEWGLLALPVAFLVVTWAWSGDWLMDRPALGRYLRLGLILAGTFGVLLTGYAGVRAWGTADPGPIAAPSTWAAAPIPADRNAADLYREAARKMGAIQSKNREIDDPAYREVMDLIRLAAVRPDCQFQQPERLTLLSRQWDMQPMRDLVWFVSRHAQDRIHGGDLAATWDDIVVLLRMARHLSEGATMYQDLQALAIEKEALDLAIKWSTAAGQTPERLRAAIAAYRDLPRLIPAAEVVRGEAILFERTIDLPAEDLKGLLLEVIVGPSRIADGNIPLSSSLYIDMITTPWERERARRVNRRFASFLAREAALEPWKQELGPIPTARRRDLQIAEELQTAPLARYLAGNTGACLNAEDRNEVERRALVQVMAIRAWQSRHDGRFPDRLEELVPGELPSLPADPYTGRPFGFATLAGANASLLRMLVFNGGMEGPSELPKETRRLYSLGPDRLDAFKAIDADYRLQDDIVFAIPPIGARDPAKPAAPGRQGGAPAKPKEPAGAGTTVPPARPGSRP
jgi:hypothetical protein